MIEGPPLPVERVRVTQEHREDWLAQQLRPRIGIYRYNGVTSYVRRPQPDEIEEPRFPSYLPPFLSGALSLASNGMVWVKRTTAFGAPPTFDVLDHQGRLTMRVLLPPLTRLVGFGVGAVYLARLDDQDLEWVERYHLP